MTRFADPTRCPDCRAPITFGSAGCPACGLSLRGETAQQLFAALSTADGLLAALRREPRPAGGPSAPATSAEAAPPAPARRTGLSAASVPKILLGLGAGCLLVAALVFLAVTWTVLGVGGRTATLVGFTVLAAVLASWMARRGLRGATESLGLVALGLLTLDLFGADNAGWLGDLDTSAFLVVLGTLVGAAAGAAAVLVRRTPVATLTGAELVAALGTGVAASGIASSDRVDDAPALLLAVLAAALVTAAALLLEVRVTALGAGLVTGLSWVGLAGLGLDRALTHDTVRELWVELHAWPLVAAAALAAVPALIRPFPGPARVLSGAVGYAVLTAAATAPVVVAPATDAAATVIVVLLVNGAVAWFAPRPWGLVSTLSTAVSAVWLVLLVQPSGELALRRLADAAAAGWQGETLDRLAGAAPDLALVSPWLLLSAAIVLGGGLLALARTAPAVDRAVALVADARAGAALVGAAAVAALALLPVPVWAVLVLLLGIGAGFVGWWLARPSLGTLPGAAAFLFSGVVLSWYDEWLTGGALGVTLVAAGVVHLRARHSEVGAVAGAVAAASTAGLGWTVGTLLEVAASTVALATVVLLAATALGIARLPGRWWRAGSLPVARAGVEVGSAAAALPVGLAGVLLADPGTGATWTAVYLTVAGAAVVVQSLVRDDRRGLAWPGGGLLALASWVRLWDVGVREPEPYTLPLTAVLAAVGLLHLRGRPETTTSAALGPALGLALVPSLVWAVADPNGVRSLLLGTACLGLVLGGLALRWTAPVVSGAVVGGVLVLRLAAPYVGDAVPRWVLIGAAGAVLIAMGVTWEQRLRDARQVVGYVRQLR